MSRARKLMKVWRPYLVLPEALAQRAKSPMAHNPKIGSWLSFMATSNRSFYFYLHMLALALHCDNHFLRWEI